MKNYKFQYQSVMESEGRMYNDIKNLLTLAGTDRKNLFNIMLAISEVFTNALIHGNKLSPDKMIRMDIGINDEVIIADIADEGCGFSESEHYGEYPDLMSEGGRGIGLMKSIADEINFGRSQETGGMRISMRFNRHKGKDDNSIVNNLEDIMELSKKDQGSVMIIALSGRLDLTNGNKLKDEIKSILATGKTSVHLNLKDVEFVNSSGLGALVSIMKEIRIHRGRLTLSDMVDYVREIFDITQLSHIFEIFMTEEEALHSYQLVANN